MSLKFSCFHMQILFKYLHSTSLQKTQPASQPTTGSKVLEHEISHMMAAPGNFSPNYHQTTTYMWPNLDSSAKAIVRKTGLEGSFLSSRLLGCCKQREFLMCCPPWSHEHLRLWIIIYEYGHSSCNSSSQREPRMMRHKVLMLLLFITFQNMLIVREQHFGNGANREKSDPRCDDLASSHETWKKRRRKNWQTQ